MNNCNNSSNNLKVKDMMEFYGFKDVRTYYMGSPCDEGDENKEYFNQYMQNVNGTSELHIPESEKDTAYKTRIWSNGVLRIGTKYKDVDEIYLGYKDTHKGRVAIGHKTIQYHNRYKTVIGIVIRGTAEDDDWDSDFDMGDLDLRNAILSNTKSGHNNIDTNMNRINQYLDSSDNDKYDHQYNTELSHFVYGYPDWTHPAHHAGFDIVSNRIIEVLNNYYAEFNNSFNDEIEILDNNTIETAVTANSRRSDDNSLVDDGVCFWVTGHSMGGGVANLVAASLVNGTCDGNVDNVYCYTFAAPNTFYRTDNDKDNYREPHGSKYRCIFNIVNDDDFVPKLPMEIKIY